MNIIYTIEAISFFCILLALVILMVEQGNFHLKVDEATEG